jgi:hypothetical protein
VVLGQLFFCFVKYGRPERSLRGERLKPPNRLVMNSILLKQMVSPREKTSIVERLAPMAKMSTDDGTIGTM